VKCKDAKFDGGNPKIRVRLLPRRVLLKDILGANDYDRMAGT